MKVYATNPKSDKVLGMEPRASSGQASTLQLGYIPSLFEITLEFLHCFLFILSPI